MISTQTAKQTETDRSVVERKGDGPKEHAKFMMQDNLMAGKYLGACLDKCRWGSITGVMWEMTYKDMVDFIQSWMKQNPDNYTELFHNETYHNTLPYVKRDKCPTNPKHTVRQKDLEGIVRCGHEDVEMLKPNYITSYMSFDKNAGYEKKICYEDEPRDPLPDCHCGEDTTSWSGNKYYGCGIHDKDGNLHPEYQKEWETYLADVKKFEDEEETFEFKQTCGAILDESAKILTFEEILDRVNEAPRYVTVYCGAFYEVSHCKRIDELDKDERETYALTQSCPGHRMEGRHIAACFDGWYMSNYIKLFLEQFKQGEEPMWFKSKK
jgi:hypothetical protein